MKRAAIYARVSTREQGEGYSLQTQVDACGEHAARLGVRVIAVLSDLYTGTSMERPQINRLRELIERDAIDLVIVYDEDRISRDMTDTLVFDRYCQQHGVELIFVQFDRPKTPEGHLFFQIRGSMAQFEHALIRERTRRGKLKKAAAGKLRTYARPYGYRFERERSGLIPEPAEAQVVRRMFEWVAEERLAPSAVARRLTALAVPSPRGKGWHPASIRRMLKSRTYLGRLIRRDERPDWQPLWVPALIEAPLFERVQAVMAASSPAKKSRSRVPRLLAGLLVCGHCGSSIRVRTASVTRPGRSRRYRHAYYHCPGRRRRPACPQPSINVRDVDPPLWEMLSRMLQRTEPWRALTAARAKDESRRLDVRLGESQRAIAARKRKLDRIKRVYLDGDLDRATYRRHLKAAQAELQDWAEIERGLRIARDGWRATSGAEQEIRARLLARSIDKLKAVERQQVVRAVVFEGVMTDRRIGLKLRLGRDFFAD